MCGSVRSSSRSFTSEGTAGHGNKSGPARLAPVRLNPGLRAASKEATMTHLRALIVLCFVGLVACASQDPAPASSSSPESASGGGETTTGSGSHDTAAASDPHIVVGTDPCTTDADCVPAGCCHAAACVARASAPACGDAVCTMECRYGTLDCGGGCLCQAGHCAARLSEMPVDLSSAPQ